MQGWEKSVSMEMLPEAHRKLAKLIGVEATLALCEAFGGTTVGIPKIDKVFHSQAACDTARGEKGHRKRKFCSC